MRNEKGITLIALVITIVVLLILAGVTITYALSDNGIFSNAKKAQAKAEEASIRDAVSNTQAEALIEAYDSSITVKSTFAAMIAKYLPTSGYTISATDVTIAADGIIAKDAEQTFTVTTTKYTHTVKVEKGVITEFTTADKV